MSGNITSNSLNVNNIASVGSLNVSSTASVGTNLTVDSAASVGTNLTVEGLSLLHDVSCADLSCNDLKISGNITQFDNIAQNTFFANQHLFTATDVWREIVSVLSS